MLVPYPGESSRSCREFRLPTVCSGRRLNLRRNTRKTLRHGTPLQESGEGATFQLHSGNCFHSKLSFWFCIASAPDGVADKKATSASLILSERSQAPSGGGQPTPSPLDHPGSPSR